MLTHEDLAEGRRLWDECECEDYRPTRCPCARWRDRHGSPLLNAAERTQKAEAERDLARKAFDSMTEDHAEIAVELIRQRDAALARVAELEAEVERLREIRCDWCGRKTGAARWCGNPGCANQSPEEGA